MMELLATRDEFSYRAYSQAVNSVTKLTFKIPVKTASDILSLATGCPNPDMRIRRRLLRLQGKLAKKKENVSDSALRFLNKTR